MKIQHILRHERKIHSCFFLFFLFSVSINAQSLVIVDSITKQPIPYVIIEFEDFKALSNDLGVVKFNLNSDTQMAELTAFGYEKESVEVSLKTDTLKMTQRIERLFPVILIDSDSKIRKTLKLRESRKLDDALIFSNAFVKTKITPKQEFRNKALVGLEIELEKHRGHRREQKETYKDTQLKCRLSIIQRDSHKNIVGLFKSDPVVVDNGENQLLKFNFIDAPILMSEPFDIYLENLGKLNGNNEFIESDRFDFLRADITEKQGKEYESISYFPKPIGEEEKEMIEMNFERHKSRVFDHDGPYTLNYRFYYK